jgi:flagellar hook assembly protein FlgD
MRQFAGVILGALAVAVIPMAAQTTEPIVGTWKLDPAKSTYKPGPAPKSTTIVVTPAGKGVKVAVDAVNADGSPLKWGFTTLRDGKEVAPVTGNPMFETVTASRESANAGTNIYKKAGKVVMTTKVAIAPDGKSMTVTTTGTDPKGQAVNNVALYTRQ